MYKLTIYVKKKVLRYGALTRVPFTDLRKVPPLFAASRILKISTATDAAVRLSPVNGPTTCYANQVLEPRVPELRIDEPGRGIEQARCKPCQLKRSNPRIKLDALDSYDVQVDAKR